jgi:cold shock CspA family protein
MQSSGIITKRDDKPFFFILDDFEQEEVFAHFFSIDKAQVGGHECIYTPGQHLVYNLCLGSQGYYADKISIDPQVEIQLEEVETSTISSWRDDYGFAKRDGCGCSIFLHMTRLPSQLRPSDLIGVRIQHEIGTREGRVYATRIQVKD